MREFLDSKIGGCLLFLLLGVFSWTYIVWFMQTGNPVAEFLHTPVAGDFFQILLGIIKKTPVALFTFIVGLLCILAPAFVLTIAQDDGVGLL